MDIRKRLNTKLIRSRREKRGMKVLRVIVLHYIQQPSRLHFEQFRPFRTQLNPLNAELNPICHLLALLGAHLIFHVRRIRVNM